jgi:phosphate starvation-inducible PhoH-like protein
MELIEKKVILDDIEPVSLFGFNDSYINLIEQNFNSIIVIRGNTLVLKGNSSELKKIERIINEMKYILQKNKKLEIDEVKTVIDLVNINNDSPPIDIKNVHSNIIYQGHKNIIRARTPKQIEYFNSVLSNDLVFSIGPAGTGKTYLAVAMALNALKKNEVGRIIISRPAVEAGESLGFLPGNLTEKIDPYLRPLTDALHNMMTAEKIQSLMEKNIIEITPLAYMRGRTLSNSFIILDEAQNATATQMKMFLTRLGANSKVIVTGDITQIDLKKKSDSGLIDAQRVLNKVNGIEFVYFSKHDVIRHRLVAEIINAYEKSTEKEK